MESAATEVVSVGRALFKDGEPSDPELQRRYRLYKRLEAALALPAGPQRLEALHKHTASSEPIRRAALAIPASASAIRPIPGSGLSRLFRRIGRIVPTGAASRSRHQRPIE